MTGRELWRRSRRRRDERGSTIPMIIGFALVLILLVGVVVDASAAYLRRQSLDTLADGAALYSADRAAAGYQLYSNAGTGRDLDLSSGPVRSAVQVYLRQIGAYERYPGLRVVSVRVAVNHKQVRVRLSARVNLPLAVPGSSSSAQVGSTGSANVTLDREEK